jgi:hypothetical protein
MRRQRDISDARENDRRDVELAPQGEVGHRPDRVFPQFVALIRAKAHRERNEAADPRSGRQKVHGVVHAMQGTFSAGLHRGVADEADARKQRRRREGCPSPSAARAEDDDSDERSGHDKMRRPNAAEGGVGEHGANLIGIDGGAPVVGHRGGLESQPCNRGDEREEAGDEYDSAHERRQRQRQPFRRIGGLRFALRVCPVARAGARDEPNGERGASRRSAAGG